MKTVTALTWSTWEEEESYLGFCRNSFTFRENVSLSLSVSN